MDLCLVGYSYRKYPLDFALDRAVSHGYSSVELRDFNGPDWSLGSLPHTLTQVGQALRGRGLTAHAVFQYPRVSRDKGLDMPKWVSLIEAMAAERIPLLHIHVYVEGMDSDLCRGDGHRLCSGGISLGCLGR